jgi:hypothetical protein
MSRSVDFWYFLSSRSANAPGRYLLLFSAFGVLPFSAGLPAGLAGLAEAGLFVRAIAQNSGVMSNKVQRMFQGRERRNHLNAMCTHVGLGAFSWRMATLFCLGICVCVRAPELNQLCPTHSRWMRVCRAAFALFFILNCAVFVHLWLFIFTMF